MSLSINLNTASLAAHRTLSSTNNALSKSIERLSSGYRVNGAGDDPAGLVISEKLRAQVGGLTVAIKNAGDATNMVKTAEGALQEVHRLLGSMRDLAVHASNTGANDTAVAAADQTQITNAIASLNKIAAETQFGNKKLLDGTAGLKALVTGSSVTGANFSYATTLDDTDVVSIDIHTAAAQATVTTDQSLAANTVGAGSFYLNGAEITYDVGTTLAQMVDKVNAVQDQTGVTAAVSTNFIKFTSVAYGADAQINLVGVAGEIDAAPATAVTGVDAEAHVTTGGTDISDALWTSGKGTQLKDTLGNTIDLTVDGADTVANLNAQFLMSGGALTFQVGAYAGQTRQISLADAHASELGKTAVSGQTVATIDVSTESGAQDALDILDEAIADVSTMRADLGATQKNVLESSVNSLTIAKENIAASESSIRDTDMASEMVTFTKLQILNQVGVAMLAQANQAPQQLLSLLR